MSKITEPMLLDKTGQQFLGLMEKQNELLTAIASGYNYKPTSIADVFAVVQSGNASQVFNYGDQIILPWTDKATGKTVIKVSPEFYRPTDVVNLWGDPTKAKTELGWNPTKTTFEELVKIMVAHDMELVKNEK